MAYITYLEAALHPTSRTTGGSAGVLDRAQDDIAIRMQYEGEGSSLNEQPWTRLE